MIIVSKRNLNLHYQKLKTESGIENKLVFVPARKRVRVPDSVADHYLFSRIVRDGTVTILDSAGRSRNKEAIAALDAEKAEEVGRRRKAKASQPQPDPEAEPPVVEDAPKSKIPVAEVLDDDEDGEDAESISDKEEQE